MSGIKKLFKKKTKLEIEKDEKLGLEVNATSLSSKSQSELVGIILSLQREVCSLSKIQSEQSSETNPNSKPEFSFLRDEIALHKEHNEKLNQELHLASSQLEHFKATLEDKEIELEIAKMQIRVLEHNSSDGKKNEDQELRAEALENFINNLSLLNNKLISQVNNLKKEVKGLNENNKNLQSNLDKYENDIENSRQMCEVLAFQKESIETELKVAREDIAHKHQKILTMNARDEMLQKEVENLNKDNEQYLAMIKDINKIVIEQDKLNRFICIGFEERINNGFKDLIHRISFLKGKCHEISLESIQNQKMKDLKSEKETLLEKLKALKIKQENAKKKVLKLNKKLKIKDEKSNSTRDLSSLALKKIPMAVFDEDMHILVSLKGELDNIYKNLMTVMSSNHEGIQFRSEDFSVFEKKYRDVLIHLHEVTDRPRKKMNISTPTANKNFQKVFFGCMRSERDTSPVKIMGLKKSILSTNTN